MSRPADNAAPEPDSPSTLSTVTILPGMPAMTMLLTRFHRPFLFFAALASLFFLSFGGWSAAVFNGNALSAFDRELAEWCNAHAPAYADLRMLMFVATHCGGVPANFVIALGGAFWMW